MSEVKHLGGSQISLGVPQNNLTRTEALRKTMDEIRAALLEVEDMSGLEGWSYEDVAYQEIGDPYSLWWGRGDESWAR